MCTCKKYIEAHVFWTVVFWYRNITEGSNSKQRREEECENEMLQNKNIVPKMWTDTLVNEGINNKESRRTNMKINYKLKFPMAENLHYLFPK